MAKNTIKTYQKFRGINQKDSPLISNMSEFSNCENFVFNGAGGTALTPDNVSLVGRVGSQLVSLEGNFFDIIKYDYERVSGSVTKGLSDTYIIGNGLFKLQKKSLTIGKTSSPVTNERVSMLLDENTNTFVFKILQGNTEVFSQDLGNGLEENPYRLYDLVLAINALPDYTASLAKVAVINGNQTTSASPSTINVDSGHDIVAGDIVTFQVVTSFEQYLAPALVLSVTATTLTVTSFINASLGGTILDNHYINAAAIPAAAIETGESNFVEILPFQVEAYIFYYELVPAKTHYQNSSSFLSFDKSKLSHIFTPSCSYVNKQNCLYFTYPVTGASGKPTEVRKFDGQNVYSAGLPPITIGNGIIGSSGSISDGTYSYLAFYKYIDYQDNIIEGQESNIISVTVSGGGGTADIPLSAAPIRSNWGGVSSGSNTANYPNIKGGTLSANTVGGNTVTLTSASTVPNFNIGDKISFRDRAHASYPLADSFTTRNVTAINYATNTVTFDGGVVTLNSGDYVTCGLSILIYRTQANGLVFYLESEIAPAVNLYSTTPLSIYTSVADDASLGRRLVEEVAGQERGKIPSMDIIGEHQGLLIGSKGNTLFFSLPLQPESFPADNYISIPEEGEITGFISDTDDRLLVFKKKSIFKIEGDILSGNYITTLVRRGDFGISSHASLKKINEYVIGLGEMGFFAMSGGSLLLNSEGDSLIGSYINPEVRKALYSISSINDSSAIYYNFERAYALNNSLDGHYECYFPNTPNSFEGLVYAFNYLNGGSWYKNTFALESITPCSSLITNDQSLFFLGKKGIELTNTVKSSSVESRIFRRLYDKESEFIGISQQGLPSEKYRYADNHLAINNKIKTRDEHLGFPSTFKEFLWFKIFSMYPFIDFDLLITTYLNFVGHSYGNPSFTLNFSSDPADLDRFHEYHKLSLNKAFAIAFQIENNTIHTCPIISGLELVASPSYEEEEPYS